AYIAPIARQLDPYMDMILVGDSTAMVGYAMDDTLSITVEQLTAHARAVVRSTSHACIVVDMPFGSYQESPEQAFRNA
ncbi:3-methyl-2-oxobutanoate hydroxymethyltransferase, partial [Mammaliicoccus sciuri]|nr:3-methyl-2-oxobutanoate hydroxymethyltransferase [Mammaliicoccus sciuri]